jgi:hypothetical protein
MFINIHSVFSGKGFKFSIRTVTVRPRDAISKSGLGSALLLFFDRASSSAPFKMLYVPDPALAHRSSAVVRLIWGPLHSEMHACSPLLDPSYDP